MKVKSALIAAVCAILLVLCWSYLLQPHFRYRDLIEKYPIGTSADRIISDLGTNVQIRSSGNVPVEVDEKVKREHAFFICRLPEANAEIHLNFYREVIRFRKISELSGKPK